MSFFSELKRRNVVRMGVLYVVASWLDTALEIRDPGIVLAGTDPLLDPLREEPRLQQILLAAGLQ